jgi:hypothetical protein
MRNYKLWLGTLLLLLGMFVFAAPVGAASEEADDEDPHLDSRYNIVYSATTKAYVSGYRYRTVGFTIRFDDSNGNPLKDSIRTQVIETPDMCDMSSVGNGLTRTLCKIPSELVYNEILSLLERGELYNRTLFISAIFEASDINGNFVSGIRYYTLDGILNALPGGVKWHPTTQARMATFFDQSLPFIPPSDAFAVEINRSEAPWTGFPVGWKSGDSAMVKEQLLRNLPGVISVKHIIPGASERDPFKPSMFRYDVLKYHTFTPSYTKNGQLWLDPARSFMAISYLPTQRRQERVPTTPGFMTQSFQSGMGDRVLVMEYDELPIDDPTPPPADFVCLAPTRVAQRVSPASGMNPTASGVLNADLRGAAKYDVSQGIPVTEDLYTNLLGKSYLFEYVFGQYQGNCNYDVPVQKTYNLSWTESVQTGYVPCTPQNNGTCVGGGPVYGDFPRYATETHNQVHTITRPYSYWAIESLRVYDLRSGKVVNYALPGDEVIVSASGLAAPTVVATKLPTWSQHITAPTVKSVTLPSESISGGSSRPSVTPPSWRTNADTSVGRVSVRNDTVTFNGATIMNGSPRNDSGVTPTDIPASPMIGNNVLYMSGIKIPREKINQANNATTGSLTYGVRTDVAGGGSARILPISGMNTVTIHTPVVNYSLMPDSNRSFDQSVNPDTSRIAMVLGRTSTITFNESGLHRSILGYGDNTYTKYTGEKRVQFPFDVYVGNTFYSASSWVNIPVGQSNLNVRIPTWVNEGNYSIRTEAWAVNAPDRNAVTCQVGANRNIDNYCAVATHNVEVIGRLYGFRVYDIGDLRYETVFRSAKGSKTWTGFQYYSGGKDKDGVTTSVASTPQNILPIRPGSHPTEAATTPHNGYPFLFYFNTVGNAWNVGEGVKITPRFYFVPKKGNTPAIEVDLYYDTTTSKMIRVGSDVDRNTFSRTISMTDPLRNVDNSFIESAARYEYDNFLTTAARASTTWAKYLQQVKNRKVNIGTGYKDITMGYQSRILVGQVDSTISVPASTQERSVQRWFGEYNLPIAPYVVVAGTNLEELARTQYKGKLDGSEPEFLKGGYIIVNFEISTYRNSQPNTPTLEYNSSNANMWSIEGQVRSSTSYLGARFDYRFGDVIMFESDFSVRDDFGSGGR